MGLSEHENGPQIGLIMGHNPDLEMGKCLGHVLACDLMGQIQWWVQAHYKDRL